MILLSPFNRIDQDALLVYDFAFLIRGGLKGMKEQHFGYGPWEYRFVCTCCGHAVKESKHDLPCSICGGDFGPKTSMRKIYLEAEKPLEIIEVEYTLEKTFWDRVRGMLGMTVPPRTEIRSEKKRPKRRWRWQTHAEVEDESGILRQDDFI